MSRSRDILPEIARLTHCARAQHPLWEDYRNVGALYIFDKRLTDCTERDNAHLLWIMCGGDLFRAAGGVIYCYDTARDYCAQYAGLAFQYVFTCVSEYVHVNSLPKGLRGHEAALLTALNNIMGNLSDGALVKDLFWQRTWNTGSRLRRAKGLANARGTRIASKSPPPPPHRGHARPQIRRGSHGRPAECGLAGRPPPHAFGASPRLPVVAGMRN